MQRPGSFWRSFWRRRTSTAVLSELLILSSSRNFPQHRFQTKKRNYPGKKLLLLLLSEPSSFIQQGSPKARKQYKIHVDPSLLLASCSTFPTSEDLTNFRAPRLIMKYSAPDRRVKRLFSLKLKSTTYMVSNVKLLSYRRYRMTN